MTASSIAITRETYDLFQIAERFDINEMHSNAALAEAMAATMACCKIRLDG